MKLAEALNRLSEYSDRLNHLDKRLLTASNANLSSILEEYNELFCARQKLRSSINSIEYTTIINGTSLNELRNILADLSEKINTLKSLTLRADITEDALNLIYSQLDNFTTTYSQLKSGIEKISWEINITVWGPVPN